ncbi:MAG: type I-U CRISPR-associated RAMP protein Csb1/Cas7u [Verrucomicrobiota bacterium]
MNKQFAVDHFDHLIQTNDWLTQRTQPVALTLTELLEPASGKDTVIFPPTYARDEKRKPSEECLNHPYAIDTFRRDIEPGAARDTAEVNACALDSVGSQANRMETQFRKTPLSALVPQVNIIAGKQKVNLLDIGHRIADGAVRHSEFGEKGKPAIAAIKAGDALPMAQLAPTSLVFGFWDSRDTQFKAARVLSSTIRATNVEVLKRSAQFNPAFDPTSIGLTETATLDVDQAPDEKDPLSKEGMRSAPAVDTHGGVRVYGKIIRRTEVNLVALRSLAALEKGAVNPDETLKLRRYILGLSLIAAIAQTDYNLRAGCLLVGVPDAPTKAEIVTPDGKRTAFGWDAETIIAYAQTVAADFAPEKGGDFKFKPESVKEAVNKKAADKEAKKAGKAAKKEPKSPGEQSVG